MAEMISPLIHDTAVIGSPPEHRDWKLGDPVLKPEIHPTAKINAFATVDGGLHQPTRVGARSFLMAHTHVGHDAQIGADVELAPGTVIGGHAVLEDGVRAGIGVMVRPFIRVGKGARLGAGAVVVKDVPAGEVWAGNPAKLLYMCPPAC
jgi:UDP-N-acetylglucosamine acyltransferase